MITIGEPCPADVAEEHVALIDYSARPGVSTFGVCNICGYAQWQHTEKAEPITNGTKFVWAESSECPKCTEVWRRAPEVFIWTIQCIKIAMLGGANLK